MKSFKEYLVEESGGLLAIAADLVQKVNAMPNGANANTMAPESELDWYKQNVPGYEKRFEKPYSFWSVEKSNKRWTTGLGDKYYDIKIMVVSSSGLGSYSAAEKQKFSPKEWAEKEKTMKKAQKKSYENMEKVINSIGKKVSEKIDNKDTWKIKGGYIIRVGSNAFGFVTDKKIKKSGKLPVTAL